MTWMNATGVACTLGPFLVIRARNPPHTPPTHMSPMHPARDNGTQSMEASASICSGRKTRPGVVVVVVVVVWMTPTTPVWALAMPGTACTSSTTASARASKEPRFSAMLPTETLSGTVIRADTITEPSYTVTCTSLAEMPWPACAATASAHASLNESMRVRFTSSEP